MTIFVIFGELGEKAAVCAAVIHEKANACAADGSILSGALHQIMAL